MKTAVRSAVWSAARKAVARVGWMVGKLAAMKADSTAALMVALMVG